MRQYHIQKDADETCNQVWPTGKSDENQMRELSTGTRVVTAISKGKYVQHVWHVIVCIDYYIRVDLDSCGSQTPGKVLFRSQDGGNTSNGTG